VSAVEKFFGAVVGVALVTTLILPKRQTPAVINASGNFFQKVLSTVMGTNTKV
jgi:hypothetical protein